MQSLNRLNRLLTNSDRAEYKPTIDLMFKLCPEMMSRKIPEANVQQAFVFDTVTDLIKDDYKVLSVGCFEDTAFTAMVEYGYDVVGIDPETNVSLRDFTEACTELYDIIFATSVIEHVKDDEQFIRDICSLLKEGGVAILTTDFRDDYTPTMALPATDERFYTQKDLIERLPAQLEKYNCALLGTPDWRGNPDFVYQGHNYSFATFVFQKHLATNV